MSWGAGDRRDDEEGGGLISITFIRDRRDGTGMHGHLWVFAFLGDINGMRGWHGHGHRYVFFSSLLTNGFKLVPF